LATVTKAYPVEVLTAMPAYVFGRARSRVDGMERLGFGAVMAEAGFRSDGSLLYNAKAREAAPRNVHEMATILPTVQQGTGQAMSPGQMDELQKLAALAKERHLKLIGIQLPLFKQATDILDSRKDHYPYNAADAGIWREFQSKATRDKFRELGIHFFDWSKHPIAANERAFLDAAHPTEYANLAALIDAARDSEFRTILPNLDVQELEVRFREAEKTGNFFDVFHDRF
jgi:hypothetical protein